MNLKGARVLVTGGHGFLGRHVVEALRARGVEPMTFRSADHDLRDWGQTLALFEETRPEVVIHIAWTGGGIGYMRSHPGGIARDNTLMACHVFEAARIVGAKKVVGIGSVCSYPKFTDVPFREEDLWLGYPEETNAPYGISKKMMLVLTQSFAEEFGLDGVHLLMVNMYGPWDNFDLESSHVIPAMVRKFLSAKEQGEATVTLWGDGTPTREFIYVTDAAEAVVLAAERYDSPDPVNIGSGTEASIRDLATKIQALVGFKGEIEWDTSKPNGQPRRRLDVSKARERFGFEANMHLDEGLRRTFEWYLDEGRALWER
ncbi:MAG: GDP-L-fucose synthase [Polyangiales bacterium]|jgi:GDP-L-fucose synthase